MPRPPAEKVHEKTQQTCVLQKKLFWEGKKGKAFQFHPPTAGGGYPPPLKRTSPFHPHPPPEGPPSHETIVTFGL